MSSRSPRRSSRTLVLALAATAFASTLAPSVASSQTPVSVRFLSLTQFSSDIEGLGRGPLGEYYAHVDIDGVARDSSGNAFDEDELFTGIIFPWTFRPLDKSGWTFTREVPTTQATVSIRIGIVEQDTGDDDTADVGPGEDKTLDLVLDLATGEWSGDVAFPERCAVGEGGNRVRLCFEISRLSATGDADGDGLLDTWETLGFDDGDGFHYDLPGFGANPFRRDLFVEIDCLDSGTHTHCPLDGAVADVVAAFAAAPVSNPDRTTGIALHVDTGSLFGAGTFMGVMGPGGVTGTYGDLGDGGERIAETGNEVIDWDGSEGDPATDFFELKDVFFDRARDPLFRYAISGHQTNARKAADDCTSGWAEAIGCNDFLVTLGGTGTSGAACWSTDASGFAVGSREEQAGTLMHELGHCLGLWHGGQDNDGRKPNYLSVMNYAFQACKVPAGPMGSGFPGGCDYSPRVLPPVPPTNGALDETSLDECRGIDDASGLFGPMDWDGDVPSVLEGVTSCQPPNNQNVAADINAEDGATEILDGFDDWQNLSLPFRTFDSAARGVTSPVDDEPDRETIDAARALLSQRLRPVITVQVDMATSALPGDEVEISATLSNSGGGPALRTSAVVSDPFGGSARFDVGVVPALGSATVEIAFVVPEDACPDDWASGVSVDYVDFAGFAHQAGGAAELDVLDVTPPELSATADPSILWPPDHTLVPVEVTPLASDGCDESPQVRLVYAVSNEPDQGLGDGDTANDVQGADLGADDRSIELRAERSGLGSGRVYTIGYEASDASGNLAEAEAAVAVPLNRSR